MAGPTNRIPFRTVILHWWTPKLRSDAGERKDGVIFNNRYEGNPKAGKVKVPVRDTEVAVADYSKYRPCSRRFHPRLAIPRIIDVHR